MMIGFGERRSEGGLPISVHLLAVVDFNAKLLLYSILDLRVASLESCLG